MQETFSETRKQLEETSDVADSKKLLEKEMDDTNTKFAEDTKKTIRILMDYTVGENFIIHDNDYPGINFLTNLDTIAGINFVSMSVNGCPITHKMLAEEKLTGVEFAIVTLGDLAATPGEPRRQTIQNRLNMHLIAV